MKKLVLLGAVATLGLTACKKDHVCTCDYGVEVKTTVNAKKSVALAMCEAEGYEVVKVEVDGEEIDVEEGDAPDCTLD